jgi:hypothetical protein
MPERLSEFTERVEVSRHTRSFARGLGAVALAAIVKDGRSVEQIIQAANWGNDHLASLVAKAAVSPTALADVAAAKRINFLSGVAPRSAAVRLFEQCPRFDLDGIASVNVASATVPSPVFIAEASPFPMISGTMVNVVLGPTHKMIVGAAVTNELEFASAENASTLIGRALEEQAGRGLDAVVFDATAASAIRDAGLLNGVTPITASVATTVLEGMTADLGALAAALGTAKCNADNMMIFAAPAQATKIKLLAGNKFTNAVIAVNGFSDGQVIALDPNAIGTAYSGVPGITTTTQATAHFEDTSPAPISTSPGVYAAPVRSAFQTNQSS